MSRPEGFPAAGFTWKVVLLTTAVVLVVSFIQVYIVYPRFIRRTVEDCRNEAMRAARNISRIVNLEEPVARHHLTPAVLDRIVEASEDFQLWKLKVFSPDGEVLFSTDEGDVGKINEHDYFFGNVARGEVYSKALWQKTATLEGQVVPVDVVETYVPIMQGDRFLGACEIYYNITDRKSGLDREELSPEVRDHLRRINRAATRASSITNNLLDFSREKGGSLVHPLLFDQG